MPRSLTSSAVEGVGGLPSSASSYHRGGVHFGIDNKALVHTVREMAPNAVIIANSIATHEVENIYAAGADYVYLNRLEAAWTLQRAVNAGLDREIDVFRNKREASDPYSPDREEILS